MKKENYNMKTKPVKRCREDVIFDTVIFIILTLILFVVAYPLYWVIISSFSDPTAVSAGKVLLRPMGFTLKGYAEVFKNSQVMRGFFNSIVNFLLLIGANVLSRKVNETSLWYEGRRETS